MAGVSVVEIGGLSELLRFNWGLGRELYTAPFIWIPADAFEEQEELAEALQLIDTRIAELHPAKTK